MSNFLKLNLKDVSKGLVVAVLVAVIGAIQQALEGHGLDFGAYDWSLVFDVAWKAASAYLVKNLLTDSDGTINLGVVKVQG